MERTLDGFVVAFPALEGDFPFERGPVIEAYKKACAENDKPSAGKMVPTWVMVTSMICFRSG